MGTVGLLAVLVAAGPARGDAVRPAPRPARAAAGCPAVAAARCGPPRHRRSDRPSVRAIAARVAVRARGIGGQAALDPRPARTVVATMPTTPVTAASAAAAPASDRAR